MTDAPDTPLTPRRERLLFRVVEEHIASGSPVGSKALAAEGEFGVSPSMIRYELAWLERAGLLDHPHTSAGRVPTDSGYRLYAERLVVDRAPGRAFPLVLEASQEVDSALQATAEALSQVTNLLSLASAPPVSATVIRHVELLLLQPQIVMAVVITASGNVSKRHFAFDQPVDFKLVESAKAYLNETVTGHGASAATRCAAGSTAPDLSTARARVPDGHRPGVLRRHGGARGGVRGRRLAADVRAARPGGRASSACSRRRWRSAPRGSRCCATRCRPTAC